MLALALQTLLLMSAAYCLGAGLACLLRRALFSRTVRASPGIARHVEPLPEADPEVVGLRRFVRAGVAPDSTPKSPTGPAAVSPPAAPHPADGAARQDLKRIHAIDAATEAALNKLGIDRYDAISRWSRTDLERIAQALAIRRQRISRENWIEQAQMLAAGAETRYARRRARGETASAAPSADQGEPRQLVARAPPSPPAMPRRRPAPASPPATIATGSRGTGAQGRAPSAGVAATVSAPSPRVSERAAFARAQPAAAMPSPPVAAPLAAPVVAPSSPLGPAAPAARPVRPPPPSGADNLQRIRGIDAPMAQRLAAAGISRYGQIATWSAADVERLGRELAASGRIARENWIEQAQILMRGGDTTFSRAFDRGAPADAAPAFATAPGAGAAVDDGASDANSPPASRSLLLGTLRSVRSQAYQNPEPGPEAAHRVGSRNRVVRSASQDLKRIRGIGVLIERRLNAMQIATYEQIANWTADDIERVSRVLDFKGRIERENWVEQARILASGGATEFSRRVDRGDLETGRYRP